MIEAISPFRTVQAKHLAAPLLMEREQYLGHLLQQGFERMVVRNTAVYLVHIVRILKLGELRLVEESEIKHAGDFWANYQGPFRENRYIRGAPGNFIKIAKAWLSFHGKLARPPAPWFHGLIEMFSEAMRSNRGLSEATVKLYGLRVHRFLEWFTDRSKDFGSVSILDVDAFIAAMRERGLKPRTVASHCLALRIFFGYAEIQRWCLPGIPFGIRSPRISKYDQRPKGPSWIQTQKLLRSADGPRAVERRAKAILFLASIYGLRCSEIARLRLDDFDWRSEVFTVLRAKHGGIQQFPIQYEVGEAILAYLQKGRPCCASRFVFLSHHRPYKLIGTSSIWRSVGLRMRDLGIELDHVGPHALRHACATRLLQRGTPLNKISEFLGHRDMGSVGVYARYDTRSLRKVAAIRLAGL
jgi:integrase/recombinase XerD